MIRRIVVIVLALLALAAGVATAASQPVDYRGPGGLTLRVVGGTVKLWVGHWNNAECDNGNVASGTSVLRNMPIRRGRFAKTARTYHLAVTHGNGETVDTVAILEGHFRHLHGRAAAVGRFRISVAYHDRTEKPMTTCRFDQPWFALRLPAHR